MKYKKPLMIAGAVLLLLIILYYATRKKPAASDKKMADALKAKFDEKAAAFTSDPLDLANPNATVNGLTRKQYLEKGYSQRDIDMMFS